MNEITIGGGETSTGGETRGRSRGSGLFVSSASSVPPIPEHRRLPPPLSPFPNPRFSPRRQREITRERERDDTRLVWARCTRGDASLRFRDTLRNRYCTPYTIYKYFYTFASRTLTVALAVRRGLRNCVDYSLTWIERNVRNWSPRFIDSNGVSIDRSCFVFESN